MPLGFDPCWPPPRRLDAALSTGAENYFAPALPQLNAKAGPAPVHGPKNAPSLGGMEKNPALLLNDQLATCLAAMQDCLALSRETRDDDEYGHMRRHDVAYVAKLMKASALLTASLARLNGQTSHNIHVHRDADKGGG